MNPVQISAGGIDARTLKQKHGDRLCFWGGGCDTREVLPSRTPAEVAAVLTRLLELREEMLVGQERNSGSCRSGARRG